MAAKSSSKIEIVLHAMTQEPPNDNCLNSRQAGKQQAFLSTNAFG